MRSGRAVLDADHRAISRLAAGRRRVMDDPDETAGRALYRTRANALARAQLAIARRAVTMREPLPTGRTNNSAARAHMRKDD
jgi:hypothetical protein